MTKVADVMAYLEEIAPLAIGIPNDEYGLLLGDPAAEVRAAGVCWLPDLRALGVAEREGMQLLVVHEHPWLSPQVSPWYRGDMPLDERPVEVARRRVYERGGISLIRIHSPWDARPEQGTVDSMARWLGLGRCLARERFTAVYSIEPQPLSAFVASVSRLLPATAPARLFGDPTRVVRRVGVAVGGFGGNQRNMPEEFARLGAEVIVWADLVEANAHYAAELGIASIETIHSTSEEPGLRELMRMLAERFPDVTWQFLPSGIAPYCGSSTPA